MGIIAYIVYVQVQKYLRGFTNYQKWSSKDVYMDKNILKKPILRLMSQIKNPTKNLSTFIRISELSR